METCDRCSLTFVSGQGAKIVILDDQDEKFFCKACIKNALKTLSLKQHKRPDEVALLANLRAYLRHETRN